MRIDNSIIRLISAAVGSQIRVREMPNPLQKVNRVNGPGPEIMLQARPFPYPPGHLQKAMIERAKQLTQDRKPMEKPSLSIVLGVYLHCTATEFFLAIAEEGQTSDA